MSYAGRYAELYDLFYAEKDYASEAAFVHRRIQEHSGGTAHRVLELACGTGKHAAELSKLGYEVVATDRSDAMLVEAKRRAPTVEFSCQDLRTLDLPGLPFDAAVCLFDSIGYVTTNEELDLALRGVHHHLKTGGVWVFEFWHAAAMLRNYDPIRVRRWQVPGGEVLRISETKLDHVRQVGEVSYTVHELRSDGTYVTFREAHANRYFLIQEMAHLLASAGFEPEKWFAGFTLNERVEHDTWHVTAIARRR